MKDKDGQELNVGDWVYFYFHMDDSDYVGTITYIGPLVFPPENTVPTVRISFKDVNVWRSPDEVKKLSEEEAMIWKLSQ